VLPPPTTGNRHQNSPELLSLKFLPLSDHHSHFWAATFDFTTFFMLPFLHGPHLFLQFGCFCVDTMYSWDLHHSKYSKQIWTILEASPYKLLSYYNKHLSIYSNRAVIFFEIKIYNKQLHCMQTKNKQTLQRQVTHVARNKHVL